MLLFHETIFFCSDMKEGYCFQKIYSKFVTVFLYALYEFKFNTLCNIVFKFNCIYILNIRVKISVSYADVLDEKPHIPRSHIALHIFIDIIDSDIEF